MQKEIAKRLIEVRDLIDYLDDGCHSKDVDNLIKISNELYSKLIPANQEKFRIWLEKKYGG